MKLQKERGEVEVVFLFGPAGSPWGRQQDFYMVLGRKRDILLQDIQDVIIFRR
jgi:hypothetical protein